MRALIQRVSAASVAIDGDVVGETGPGLLILICAMTGDSDGAGLLDNAAPQVVLLTRGADGVTVITRRGRFDVAAQRATVVDTVGAGDTFNAGFLAGLDQAGLMTKAGVADATDDQLREAAELGAKAAAITVSRAGANPPWSHEL